MAIKDSVGEWIFEEMAIKEHIRNGLRVFIPLLFPVLPELPLLFPDGKLVSPKRRNKALGGLLWRMKLKRHYGL